MKSDPCRTPSCQWRDRCPLRPLPPAAPASAVTLGKQQPPPAAPAEAPAFSVRDDLALPIGVLSLHGAIHEHTMRAPLAALEEAAPRLRGLFVKVYSPGGTTQNFSEMTLRAAARRIPVVCHVRVAFSAALTAAATCGVVFIDPDGVMGRFGVVFHACDGARRRLILSAQAPEKTRLWVMERPPGFFIDGPESEAKYQALADTHFEADLGWIAFCRGLDPEKLRPIMDGRKLDARGAVDAGLVGGIRTEAAAFEIFLTMARNGRKKLF